MSDAERAGLLGCVGARAWEVGVGFRQVCAVAQFVRAGWQFVRAVSRVVGDATRRVGGAIKCVGWGCIAMGGVIGRMVPAFLLVRRESRLVAIGPGLVVVNVAVRGSGKRAGGRGVGRSGLQRNVGASEDDTRGRRLQRGAMGEPRGAEIVAIGRGVLAVCDSDYGGGGSRFAAGATGL